MGVKQSQEELMFIKSRNSVQEVSGWKVFIFFPQNTFWRFVMIITITGKFVYTLSRAIYGITPPYFELVDGILNALYFLDVILATMHAVMGKVRKLRHGFKRRPFFLVLDYVSMLPLKFIYDNTVYNMNPKDQKRGYYFSLVGILRTYQVPVNFANIKASVHEVKTYLIITIVQVIFYYLILTYFLSCFLFIHFDEDTKKMCLSDYFICVFDNFMRTFVLISQNFYKKSEKNTLSDKYDDLLTVDIFIGYFFTYGYVLPTFLHIIMKYLITHFEYCRKQMHVKVLIENVIKDKKLKKNLLTYFDAMWSFESGDAEPELMKVMPLCLKKKIFSDIYWEAIRHSYLLQDLSIGCKRSLALGMRTEVLLPQTTLFEKEKNSTHFVYLQSGLLQLMAEENDHTPVLSLSTGTVMGEMSFFMKTKSKAIVRAANFSVIHVLPMRHFFRVLADYPNDKKQVHYKVNVRLKLAKSTYNIKANIFTYFSFDRENSKLQEQTKWGNIKWIKGQYRGISSLQKQEKLLKLHQYTNEDYDRWVLQLSTQMKHTSVNLPLLNVGDNDARNEGIVCLKSFPWLMDPQCQFVLIWKKIIIFVTLIILLIYPPFIAWFPHIPSSFFVFSCVVTLVFITDIAVQFFTAVKINNDVIQKFGTALGHRFFNLRTYFDIASALPLQVFTYYFHTNRFGSNIYFVNALLKVYVLVPAINYWNYSLRPMIYFRTIVKYTFLLLIVIYVLASTFYLTGVECTFYDCSDSDWFTFLNISQGSTGTLPKNFGIYMSLYRAIMLTFERSIDLITDVFVSFFIHWIMYFLIRAFSFAMEGECIASYVLDLSYDVEYKFLMDFIFKYMGKNKMVGNVRKRVMATMEFQWKYDKNNYIKEKRKTWNTLPYSVRDVIDLEFVLPALAKCKLFQWEDEPFLVDLCKRVSPLALPANSLLLTLGIQSKCLYVIQKGFVQINSFIAGDLHLNISKPIKVKAGNIFPVIDVLSQTPSAVTAVTVSDCELLLLDLEDVISTMMIHGIFKDFVEAINDTDLSKLNTAKLGVSDFKKFSDRKDHYEFAFDNIKYMKIVLRCLLRKRAINSESRWYMFWELGRVLTILIAVILWPIAFGCCTNSSIQPIIIKVLFGIEMLHCIDFYIRIHVAYYNKLGIYVTHTLYTTGHYLMTTFITDLVAFGPNFHILHVIITNTYDFHWSVIVVHVLLRSISLYRFIGFLEYHRKSIRRTGFVVAVLFIALGVHYYINLMVHFYIKGVRHVKIFLSEGYLSEFSEPYKYYFNELVVMLFLAMKTDYIFMHYADVDVHSLVVIVVVNTLSVLGKVCLCSHLILLSTTSNKSLTTYRHHRRNFINYLTRQKAEDSIINIAVQHFEHEWLQQYGYDVHKIFSDLPQTLHEDILYPLYHEALSAVRCFSQANEYFFRTLSVNIEEVFLEKESVIIFHKEVQANIFFVERGKCFVEDLSQVLYKGAMIGDIKRQGIMKNKITAKTDVKLLKIPSHIFFLILENFYATKMEFQLEAANADNFIPSICYEPPKVHQETVLHVKENLECEFVSSRDDHLVESNFAKKRKKWRINPKSIKVRCLRFILMIVAYITIIIIPIFMAIRLFSPAFLSIIYVLDVLWLAEIILSTNVPGIVKKDSRRNKGKRKSLKGLRKFCRILCHVLPILPIELLPLALHNFERSDKCCFYMCICYVNRLLRGFYIFQYFGKKGKKLIVNFSMKVMGILMFSIAVMQILVAIIVALDFGEQFQQRCYETMDPDQKDILKRTYLIVINLVLNSGYIVFIPKNIQDVCIKLVITFYEFVARAILINHVLMILFIIHHNKANQMLKIQHLDRFLSARDVSPILRFWTEKYFCNLLNSFYEGASPVFLYTAPPFIKTDIMENLYMSHLSNCFAFQGLENAFLKQLTTRMYLNIYFPGDYITERGDVDHNMHFIQAGEVHCIETDSHYKVLERVTDVYSYGDHFGVLQGIFSAYPHTHTRRAKTLTRTLVLNYYKWEDLRSAFPEDFNSVYNRCKQSLVVAERNQAIAM